MKLHVYQGAHQSQDMTEAKGTSTASVASLDNGVLVKLLNTRGRLQQALQKCRTLGHDLDEAGPRLQRIATRIPSLETAFEPLRCRRKILDDLPACIDKAVAPSLAVLKVFDAMHDLEPLLLGDPQHDLVGFISLISRLEEATAFLSENCPMAIEWLQEFIDFLDQNQVLQDTPMQRISSHLDPLQAWRFSGDHSKLDGGLHAAALDKLECEFKRLLSDENLLVPSIPSDVTKEGDPECKRTISSHALKHLHLILQKLVSNGRNQRIMELYVESRTLLLKRNLNALPLNYLQMRSSSKHDWKSVGAYIGPWTQHMDVVMRSLCEPEYNLCNQVFEKLGYDYWEQSFGKIALGGGVMALLEFGEMAVRSKDEPQKLFKLLDMFEAMNNLRPLFGKLFGGPGSKEVQQRVKGLLKLIVQGAYDIFLELKQQIDNQRGLKAPIDESLPKVLSFVLGYVKHLVGDFYGPIMAQVLMIHRSWSDDSLVKKTNTSLLSKAVLNVMNALVLNINEWASSFKDEPVFYHLFLCNNFWYLSVNCRTPELKVLVGDTWLKEQRQQAEANISMYMKEGWSKIVHLLNVPGVMTLTGSRAAARDLLKTKLKAFNMAFEELYQKHVKWVIVDAELRERIGISVLKLVVPAYRTYLQSYGPLLEQDGTKSKHVKYSAQSLERVIGSLFQGPSERIVHGSDRKVNGSSAIVHPTTVSVI
ncbi:hypothetical protein KP509_27G068800 [Ceratopteris richardii]|nr:hypothetical protein KP509_27G068800 [Ceratopteris richardii]